MKRLVLVLSVLVFGVVGCTKQEAMDPVCKIAVKSLYGTAQGVAEVLKCNNPAAIAADLAAPIYKYNLCQANAAAGTIGNLVCPQVTKTVISLGMSAIPADWGCEGGASIEKLETTLVDSCKKYVKF